MVRTNAVGTTGTRVAVAVVLLAAGTGVVGWLAPARGSEGAPVRVVDGPSATGYRRVAAAVADAPHWLASLLEPATEAGLLVLGLLLALCWWTARGRRATDLVAGAVLTGLGTVLAYGASEVLKVVIDEERPCRALLGTATASARSAVAECPPPGDWSFPSNHATLAVALATGLVLLRPRWGLMVVPVGGLTAALRVAAGVHYPHDVVAGAVLGAAVTGAVVVALLPLATTAVAALAGVRVLGPLLVGPQPPVPSASGARTARALRAEGQAGRVREDGGGRPVGHPEPQQDGAHMGFHGPLHHPDPAGDLAVREPGGDQRQHVPLPAGQRGHLFPDGGAPVGRPAGPGGGQVGDHPRGHLG